MSFFHSRGGAECDWGKDAFTTSNMFSGSAPADLFGLAVT